MKIAIQGHPTRGKEVIRILESLGGINKCLLKGNTVSTYYYIDYDSNNTIHCHNMKYVNKCCKIYTLEEFEKEFPFKVGDKVIHKEFNDFFEVISFNPGSSYPYKIKGVCTFNTKSHVLTKWQPKMKEERFVTLTLEKAKEWYKKDGELREIALQAFTEKELISLPRSWEEFCDNYMIDDSEAFFDTCSEVCIADKTCRHSLYDRNMCPSKKSAEAHLAMIQLEQLRDCWRQGWIPSKGDVGFGIRFDLYDGFKIIKLYATSTFLSFPTEEIAKEFLECFKNLIEKAGDLI